MLIPIFSKDIQSNVCFDRIGWMMEKGQIISGDLSDS